MFEAVRAPGAFIFQDSADSAAWCPQQDSNLRPSD